MWMKVKRLAGPLRAWRRKVAEKLVRALGTLGVAVE
jgi:hypothetical protein